MKDNMKQRIAQVFSERLQEKPLEQITVKELTETQWISRKQLPEDPLFCFTVLAQNLPFAFAQVDGSAMDLPGLTSVFQTRHGSSAL